MSSVKCKCKSEQKITIGVFTSGGDAQGMNATLRSIVRCGLHRGCKIYLIREGYRGMIDGGDNIELATWASVSSIIHLGGTVIGSARCEEFKDRCGRKQAALNLVKNEITNLICIGGDGTLTAADIFRQEWSDLLSELTSSGKITKQIQNKCSKLNICGIIGSIDNDFCGTDVTIGSDTALHRILESVRAIKTTAESHQRTFIIEVMGRYCGYLGVISAIMSQATYAFIPESPPPVDWPDKLCKKLCQEKNCGQRSNIIIVAEGAQDLNCNPITCQEVKEILVERLQCDTRIAVLGHIQRGGNTSCNDRILSCRIGEMAIMTLMDATNKTDMEPFVICLRANQIVNLSLMKCVEETKAVTQAIAEKNFEQAVELRGQNFKNCLKVMHMMLQFQPCTCSSRRTRLGVMHIGDPASGMNAATAAFVRGCVSNGNAVYGIYDGIDGLVKGEIKELTWSDVNNWVGEGGSKLGTRRTLPHNNYDQCAKALKQFNIKGLLIIGGFDAFLLALHLMEQRCKYKEFCIPMVVLPATISNNVPGSQCSVGADTSLATIMDICDRCRAAAQGIKHQIYLIEMMGNYCGYLATMAGLSSGADAAYIFEENITINDLLKDITNITLKINSGTQRGLILSNERTSANFTTDFIHKLYQEEGKGQFFCRKETIGHLQLGGAPTPMDALLGCELAEICVQWITDQFRCPESNNLYKSEKSVVVVGLVSGEHKITPIVELAKTTDFLHRKPKDQWWMKLRNLMKELGLHETAVDYKN